MEKWVSGPSQPQSRADRENKSDFSLIDPDSDKEIKSVVKKTSVEQFNANRFVKFSTWNKLICAFRLQKRVCFQIKDKNVTFLPESVEGTYETELFVLRSYQRLSFKEKIECLHDCIAWFLDYRSQKDN